MIVALMLYVFYYLVLIHSQKESSLSAKSGTVGDVRARSKIVVFRTRWKLIRKIRAMVNVNTTFLISIGAIGDVAFERNSNLCTSGNVRIDFTKASRVHGRMSSAIVSSLLLG